jgi:hypothetical protein
MSTSRKKKVANLEESDLELSPSSSDDSNDDFNDSDDTKDLILQSSSDKKSTNHASSPVKKTPKKTSFKSKTTTPKQKVMPPSSSNSASSKKLTTTSGSVITSKSTVKKKIDGSSAVVKSKSKQSGNDNDNDNNDSFDVVLPLNLLGNDANVSSTGTCSVLIQVDPNDAKLLDFEGVTGAIGRFESTENGIVLDLKGCQYQGSLLPGPTALVVGFSKGGQLSVEGITDEFATLVKTNDSLAKLDAVVKGHMDDSFEIRDENVNVTVRNNNNKKDQADGGAADSSALTTTAGHGRDNKMASGKKLKK